MNVDGKNVVESGEFTQYLVRSFLDGD